MVNPEISMEFGIPGPNPNNGRTEPRVIDANDPSSVLEDAERDMSVISSDGARVGVVDEIASDGSSRRTALIVEHGRLTKRHKLVDGTLVDLIDDGIVMLSIDQQEFRALPDMQD